jgi:hypothetical protein
MERRTSEHATDRTAGPTSERTADTTQGSRSARPPRPDPRPLAILATLATALGAVGVLPRWPGLVHLVALPPFDLVGDLGLLLVVAPSRPWFALGLLVSLTVRVTVLAAMLGGLDRAGLLRALRFHLVVLPFAALAAVLLYAAPAILFYGLFWFGFVVVLLLTLAVTALPWQPQRRLRSALGASLRAGLRVGTVLAYLALLTLVGALADLTGAVGSVLLVPVSAALTWATALVLVEPTQLRVARRAVAVVPVAAVVALVVVVMSGPAAPPTRDAPATPREGSLLLMSGIDSASGSGAMLEIDPNVVGFPCERTFYASYAGPGDGQPRNDAACPITTGAPYEEQDTLRSRDELVPWLAAQLEPLPAPVTAAVHSQGVWIAWEAAARGELPTLGTLVLVGPFPTNPVAFPTDGSRGPGAVGADVLRLAEVLQRPGGGTTVFEVASPLTEEWLADPDRIDRVLAEPLPDGLTAVSVPSLFDVPLMPDGWTIDGVEDACPVPVTHPNLPYAEELLAAVERAIDGEPLDGCPVWRRAIGPAFRHHSVPPSRG